MEESKPKTPPLPEGIPYAYIPYPMEQTSDDEISLLDLFRILNARKVLIVVITVCVFAFAAAYAFFAPKTYTATVTFAPAQDTQLFDGDLSLLNSIKNADITTDNAFQKVKEGLSRRDNQTAFLLEQPLTLSDKGATITANEFSGLVSVDVPKKSSNEITLVVSLEGPPVQAAKLANAYAQFVISSVNREMLEAVQFYLKTKLVELDYQIEDLKAAEYLNRQDEIEQLREALIVSSKLSPQNTVIEILRENQITLSPKYEFLFGSQVLESRIENLKHRSNTEAFIPGLREKQLQRERLQGLSEHSFSFRPARIEQAAETPSTPVKPKVKLVLILGLVLGGMLGIFAAFIAHFIQQQRAKVSEA